MADSFIFYKSFQEAIKCLAPDDRLQVYEAIADYGLYGEYDEPSSGVVKAILMMAIPQMDANAKRRDAGKSGGRPKKKPEVSEDEESEKPMVSENEENEKPMVLENENQTHYNNKNKNKKQEQEQEINNKKESNRENRSPQFKKPTIAEIQEYCKQRGNNVDAEQFFSFYESNGWKVGRVPMKDWKMCVITWEKRDKKTSSARKYPSEDYRRRIEVPTMEDWENEQGTI